MIAAIVLVLIIIFIFYFMRPARSKKFYEVTEVYPQLTSISAHREDILAEVTQLSDWTEWPEKNLWDPGKSGASWTIFPLRAFGRTIPKNCARVPTIAKFVEEMDKEYGVKVAILSRLGPGMKLVPHQGWGGHCNYVLRCHYGIIVPAGTPSRNCNIQVADEVTDKCECAANDRDMNSRKAVTSCNKCYDGYKYTMQRHANDKWIVFDDSKFHTAENLTDSDRIVLILDIVRPCTIPAGTSTVEDTQELENIVAAFSV